MGISIPRHAGPQPAIPPTLGIRHGFQKFGSLIQIFHTPSELLIPKSQQNICVSVVKQAEHVLRHLYRFVLGSICQYWSGIRRLRKRIEYNHLLACTGPTGRGSEGALFLMCGKGTEPLTGALLQREGNG